ncbi:MAG: hypothetical protein RR283_09350, partial [Comamonas sp.]
MASKTIMVRRLDFIVLDVLVCVMYRSKPPGDRQAIDPQAWSSKTGHEKTGLNQHSDPCSPHRNSQPRARGLHQLKHVSCQQINQC